jgi:hypothetical protein
MRFRVSGANRQTGRDAAWVYEAASEAAAVAMANADGVVVAEVTTMPDAAAATRTAPALPAGPTLPYRTPSTQPAAVPSYVGLQIAGGVLGVYAIFCYLLGGLALLGGLFAASMGFAGAPANQALPRLFFGVIAGLAPALALLFAGAVSHGLSAACVALRDIARNSWR